jgi:TetR/AcrR family transcriptional repressor of nem operon
VKEAALLEAWHGAMLRVKIERSPAPLERFMRLTFPALLAGPALIHEFTPWRKT